MSGTMCQHVAPEAVPGPGLGMQLQSQHVRLDPTHWVWGHMPCARSEMAHGPSPTTTGHIHHMAPDPAQYRAPDPDTVHMQGHSMPRPGPCLRQEKRKVCKGSVKLQLPLPASPQDLHLHSQRDGVRKSPQPQTASECQPQITPQLQAGSVCTFMRKWGDKSAAPSSHAAAQQLPRCCLENFRGSLLPTSLFSLPAATQLLN